MLRYPKWSDLQQNVVLLRISLKKICSRKPRNPDGVNGFCEGGNVAKVGQGWSHVKSQNQLLHMKMVRRRLHTSRPYQERLLNMAEAWRQIVTDLKSHRASMKQQQPMQPAPDLGAKTEMNSGKRYMIYPSDGGQKFTKFPQSVSGKCDSPNHMTVPTCYDSSFSFPLPSQTLGLNLNFHDFSNLSSSPFQTLNPSSLFASPSSPSLSSTTTDEIHSEAEDSQSQEVLKEMKSMGWNDYTMNLMTSPWWLELSKDAETSPEELLLLKKSEESEHLFTEIPSWLNPTGSCYLHHHHLNIACPHDSSPDPSLPCIEEIGEIEGLDADWLS